jgi:RNA polymerase sigma factor (sigma-70 family)
MPRPCEAGRTDGHRSIANRPDAEVIRQSLVESEVFEVIFSRHVDAIYGFVARRMQDEPSAIEDLVCDTFETAFDQRRRYRGDHESAGPWLFGIANHLISHHRRSERTRLLAYSRALRQSATDEAGGSNQSRRLLDADVMAMLASLKADDREAILLMTWGELSYAEIAAAQKISVGTVRSRIHRARRQLRELL